MRSRLSAAGKVSLLVLVLTVAAAAGSWALLAETSRMVFGHAWSGWDRWAHRRADQSAIYEYGGAKLAHAGGIAIAAGGLAVALWIAARCVEQLLRGGTVPDQRSFAVAASIAALVGAIAAIRSNLPGQSPREKVRALILPALVLIGLTMAALTRDGTIALGVDVLIALLVASVMAIGASVDVSAAVAGLIDHPIAPAEEVRLARLLQAQGLDPGEVVAVRARRAGAELLLEVMLDPRDLTVEEACSRIGHTRAAMERSDPGLKVTMHWSPAA